jgi:hypothetical protein
MKMRNQELMKWKVLLLLVVFIGFYNESYGQNKIENPAKISFKHHTHEMQGWFFKAAGNGPFPTVILLQGSVGNDGDLFDLGLNLAEEGYNAMTYNYPGAWRSEGLRTDKDALESIQSAIDYIMSKSTIQMFEIDKTDIILLGYSYGGGMALLGAAMDNRVAKVISIAGGDLSIRVKEFEEDPGFRQSFEQRVDYFLSNPSMARGTNGKQYVDLMIKNKEDYNIKKYVPELSKKEVLLISGSFDNMVNSETHIMPLYEELKSKGNGNVSLVTLDTDHSFSNVQNELTETIHNWLKEKE